MSQIMPAWRRIALVLGAAASFALAGCAGNPARDLAVAAGVTGGEPKPPPDFVSRTRRSNLDYIPVGTSAPRRAYRVKTQDEVKGAESELEGRRASSAAKAAQ
jgi:hypothetical protein